MRVGTHAFSLVIHPLALVYIAIGMNQFTLPVGLIVAPLTFIAAAVRPQLCANTIAHAIKPLASVLCTVTESVWTLRDSTILIFFIWSARSLAKLTSVSLD